MPVGVLNWQWTAVRPARAREEADERSCCQPAKLKITLQLANCTLTEHTGVDPYP
ncbi:hypothetical protein J7E73_11170 [Paenibacillus albidus]|uniref:hypothetical protein n=1 Tax=Paenibacillus albidus TaxID=2041023 RepID=UPI001BEAD56F|nr:hypothetical protein [Paenibacillus albidus]MBT2289685.1 hypothetical protein [Paenibacillus albidus]